MGPAAIATAAVFSPPFITLCAATPTTCCNTTHNTMAHVWGSSRCMLHVALIAAAWRRARRLRHAVCMLLLHLQLLLLLVGRDRSGGRVHCGAAAVGAAACSQLGGELVDSVVHGVGHVVQQYNGAVRRDFPLNRLNTKLLHQPLQQLGRA